MILLIDHYDSFVYNLAHYVAELGHEYQVYRHDDITLTQIREKAPTHIILSPGPRGPEDSGLSIEIVRQLGAHYPILGVCLGHQIIAHAFSAKIARAVRPRHGIATTIWHKQRGLFHRLAYPMQVACYHALVVVDHGLPSVLQVTARDDQDSIMAMQHRTWPVYGVQFHPESVLTDQGHALLKAFLEVG